MTGIVVELTEQLAHADMVTCLEVAEQALRRVRACPLPSAASDHELVASVQRFEALSRMCAGQKLRLVNEIAQRQAFRGHHSRTVEDLLSSTLHLSRGAAKNQAELAEGLQALPQVAAAVADGRLGVEQAEVAVRKVAQIASREDGAALTAQLDQVAATQGQSMDKSRLSRVLDGTVAVAAPDAVRTREQRAHARRGVWFDNNGELPQLRATLSVEGYATVKAAVEALGRPDGEADTRTVAQRQHDALLSLATSYLDAGELPQVAAQRPHVILLTTPGALHGSPDAEPSALDGVGAVSNDLARQVCCDADITTLLADGDKVLNVGRQARTATKAQRAAVIARDRVCIGCDAPATRCEVHHIRWWTDGGATDLNNLALVCWNCHRHIHHHQWQITTDQWGRLRAHPPGQPPPAHAPPRMNRHGMDPPDTPADAPDHHRNRSRTGPARQLDLAHTG